MYRSTAPLFLRGTKDRFLLRHHGAAANCALNHFNLGSPRSIAVTTSCWEDMHIPSKFKSSCKFYSRSNLSLQSTSFEYEYPTRTERPTITKTLASELKLSNPVPTASTDSSSAASINTALPESFKITSTPPAAIPSNLPPDSLTKPCTQISILENGIRVASQETYGQVCTFGLISNCGSRLESSTSLEQMQTQTTGVNHLMELLAFCGTKTLDSTSYQNKLDTLGGVSFASSSREQFLYCIDVLRPNIDLAMDMLQDVVLYPDIHDDVVDEMKRVIEFQWMDIIPEILVSEGLQIAAYGPIPNNENASQQQQLGKCHFCPMEALSFLNADTIINFRNKHLLDPHSIVIAGAGIEHEHLVELANKYFRHLQPTSTSTSNSTSTISSSNNPNEAPHISNGSINSNGIIESTYTGGLYKKNLRTQDGFTRVALAFPTGGWHSDDLVPSCVLQTLLGGGSSFSAGGPGKGMYSRLYRQVLNRYYWAESCEAFTSFHNESGLLGISGSSIANKSGDMIHVLAENFMRLAIDHVTDEELSRARNMLKCNVLTQLESRLVLFEDVGRQILTYGKREDSHEMCAKIDDVTKDDIRTLARASIIGMKPTLCAVGDDVSQIPAYEEVERWFQSL